MEIKKYLLKIIAAVIVIASVFSSGAVVFAQEDNPNGISSVSDTSSSSKEDEAAQKEDNGIKLVMTSPTKKVINTTKSKITFKGKSDPEEKLTLNGKTVKRDENGSFSVEKGLKVGKNTFKFSHKGKTYAYTVNYRYVIISKYTPSLSTDYQNCDTIKLSVYARKGSKVTAKLKGTTVTLKLNTAKNKNNTSKTFEYYCGSFKLPKNNKKDINLGSITFKGTYKGKSESFKSGNIKCKKYIIPKKSDPKVTPKGGKYIDVGSGKIAEIVAYEAETFNPRSTNDMSRPTNNYLPKGTVDYSSQSYYYYNYSEGKKKYVLLRCGRQVYATKKDIPRDGEVAVVKEYIGVLPDHNEIGIEYLKTGTTHTTLKLNTMWKAPFYFDMKPQSYENPKAQDYKITDFTCKYIDITFCYATVLKGAIKIPKNNPIFKSAKIIKNKTDDKKKTRDYTIRLYLKKQGGFYGWDSYYDKDGNLIFKFLNPHQVEKADNKYGVDLKGARILIDVGHGGKDGGASGFNPKKHSEAIRNLFLAKKLKKELESIGAKVYMTRTDDSLSSTDDKIKLLKKLRPDYCICIHHDSSASSKPNGFGAFYSQPISKKAAEYVYKYTKQSGIYNKSSLNWHYYYMARSSYCPVVLTENGYMSNYGDYKNIISTAANTKKAQALTKAIAKYFLSVKNT